MDAGQIAAALETASAPVQRGEVLRFAKGFTVINDSYNSNPAALISMVETLVNGAANAGRKIVVAGEMLELGESAPRLHHEAGQAIADAGIDLLIGVRGLAAELVNGARQAGLEEALFAESSEKAGGLLSDVIRQDDVVLVKGSRGVRTEKVIEKLLEKFELEQNVSGKAV
jgi:UDP-N-acetylmuramoyl-tripeptide--D-alanyl-D-alanine ligase